jgi:WD40 repeat protein
MKQIATAFILLISTLSFAQKATSPIIFKLQGHSEDLQCMAMSGNGKFIASGSWDGLFNIFKTDTNYTPNGSYLDHISAVNAIAITSTGKFIATGSIDGTVITYKSDSFGNFTRDKNLPIHRLAVNSLYIDGTGKYVYTGSNDGTISFYDIPKLKDKRITNGSPVTSIAVTNDRRNIFCSDNTSIIKKYDLEGKVIKTLEGHTDQVNHIILTKDNKYLISASSDKTIRIWNVQTNKLERTLTGHDWKVVTLAVSLNNKYIVSGSNDGSIKVWDFETGAVIKSIDGVGTKVRGVGISNDFSRVFAAMHYDLDSFESAGILVFKSGIEIVKKEPPKVPGKPGSPAKTPQAKTPATGNSTDPSKQIIKKTPEIEISEDKKKTPEPKTNGER